MLTAINAKYLRAAQHQLKLASQYREAGDFDAARNRLEAARLFLDRADVNGILRVSR